jgi:hypothetical protein
MTAKSENLLKILVVDGTVSLLRIGRVKLETLYPMDLFSSAS